MRYLFVCILACLGMCVLACGEDDTLEPIVLPQQYNFEPASYPGQLERLAMLQEWKDYMVSSRTDGAILDAERMRAMYANTQGADFATVSDKNLESKTFELEQATIHEFIEAIAAASTSTVAAAEGQAGILESEDGTKSFLLSANGLEYEQLIEKGIMGACFYYQATSVYLGDEKMNVDNEIVDPLEGTEMQHHWDEAWGYFGAPIDFPDSNTGSFWANYSLIANDVIGSNEKLKNAFILGRYAIGEKDIVQRNLTIAHLRVEWEKVLAASALHYLNNALDNFDDFALRAHALSEAIAFIYAMQFNEGKTIENSKVSVLLDQIAGSDSFPEMNLHPITIWDIEDARNYLAEQFNYTDIRILF
ncbi:DUF4856 domain-containing protein [Chitinophagales bacterium]|nr:DUF4856 domain-containing protein [Chitinophagales bacterium]